MVGMSVVGALGQGAASIAANNSKMQAQAQQYKAAKERKLQNDRAARLAAVRRYATTQNRINQEREAAVQKKREVDQEALAARSKARASAADSGVSGLSVDALIQDFNMQEADYDRSVDENFSMTEEYLRGEMDAQQDQAVARMNSVPDPVKPDFSGANALGLFGTVARTASSIGKTLYSYGTSTG